MATDYVPFYYYYGGGITNLEVMASWLHLARSPLSGMD